MALHYYEYTRDFSSDNYLRHVSDQIDGGNWTDVLSDSYFGRSDPYSGEILNGRWAGLETPFASDYFYASQGVLLNETFFPDEEVSFYYNYYYCCMRTFVVPYPDLETLCLADRTSG